MFGNPKNLKQQKCLGIVCTFSKKKKKTLKKKKKNFFKKKKKKKGK